jgi:hypothetical protein
MAKQTNNDQQNTTQTTDRAAGTPLTIQGCTQMLQKVEQ